MRDAETLHELMTEDEEWLVQLEAAEGLVELGDRRGYEFLATSLMSDDEEIIEVAREILNSPDLARMKNEMKPNGNASTASTSNQQGSALSAARSSAIRWHTCRRGSWGTTLSAITTGALA